MSINTKKLCQLLKQEAKHALIWSKTEEGYTVTDRHFMVRFNEIPRDVMSVLLSIFLRIPEIGQSLRIMDGELQEDCAYVSHNNVSKYEETDVEGGITPYSKNIASEKARVFRFGDRFGLIQERYAELTTDSVVKGCKSPNHPIFLADGAILVCPFRIADGNATQSELLKITTYFEYNIQA